jgi:hypothetical protein
MPKLSFHFSNKYFRKPEAATQFSQPKIIFSFVLFYFIYCTLTNSPACTLLYTLFHPFTIKMCIYVSIFFIHSWSTKYMLTQFNTLKYFILCCLRFTTYFSAIHTHSPQLMNLVYFVPMNFVKLSFILHENVTHIMKNLTCFN